MVLPSLSECAATFDRLAPVLLNVAARSVVVLGLAASVTLMMRRASAAARHWMWLLGFAGLLVLPVVSSTLPGWHVLPRIGANHAASPTPEVIVLLPPVLSPRPQPQNLPHDSSALPVDTNSKASDAVAGQAPIATPPQASAVKPSVSSKATTPAAVTESVNLPAGASNLRIATLPWTVWLVLCWFTGTLLVLGYVFLGHLSLWWLQRRCARTNPGELSDLLDQLRGEIGERREVQLLSSPMRTMPMTWGLWRPRLLLPEQALTWPASQRRSVLLHELSHVKRWDCLTQLLAQLACALYWFNPLGWIAARRMTIERERACDDMVLNTGAEPSSYAKHLLHSVSSMPAFRLAGAAVAMARVSTLEERLRAILDVRRNRRALTIRGELFTVLLLSAALVPVALLKAQEAPAPVPAPAGSDATSTPTSAPSRGPASTDSREVQQWRMRENSLELQLADLEDKFGEDNPDVMRVERQLAQVRAILAARGTEPSPTTRPAPRPAAPSSGGRRGPENSGVGRTFGGVAERPAPTPKDGPTCVFDATIYDVRIPVDQIGRLDVDALARTANSADAFEKALAALGTTQPLYRANQSFRLSGDNILIGAEVPVVTSTRMGDKGQAINSITYQSMGANFALTGNVGAAGDVDLELSIQLSAASTASTPIAGDVKAPLFRRAIMSHKGSVQPHKSFVVLSVDASSVDAAGKAVAYIGRITIGEPQSTTTRPAGGN